MFKNWYSQLAGMCSSILPSSECWPIFTRKGRLNTAEAHNSRSFLLSCKTVCQTWKVTSWWRFDMFDNYIFDFWFNLFNSCFFNIGLFMYRNYFPGLGAGWSHTMPGSIQCVIKLFTFTEALYFCPTWSLLLYSLPFVHVPQFVSH